MDFCYMRGYLISLLNHLGQQPWVNASDRQVLIWNASKAASGPCEPQAKPSHMWTLVLVPNVWISSIINLSKFPIFILECPSQTLTTTFTLQWEFHVCSSYEPDYAVLPAVPLCLHVKWYWGARSVSLVSFHSQYPRLEAVRRTDMGTFRDRLGGMFTSLVFSMPPQPIMPLKVVCGQTVMDGLSSALAHGPVY